MGASAQYCLVQGGVSGTGNVSADPEFVDQTAGDLRVLGSSPAIDAGSNAAVPGTVTLDAAGGERFQDLLLVADSGAGTAPVVDLGAFELQTELGEEVACTPQPNSTGSPSVLAANGSPFLNDNLVQLDVTGLPTGQFAYFVLSDATGSASVGSGTLCLGPPIVRLYASLLNTGAAGSGSFVVDLTALPQGTVIAAGETWSFQLWHRDQGATSNFSNALGLTWE